MTNAELIAKIKAEIERRKKALHCTLFNDEYNDLLSFLDTLESEKPMNLDELMKEAQRYYSDNFEYLSSDQPTLSILTNVARHFAEWGAEHAKIESEKPVPKDLEEAAGDYASNSTGFIDMTAYRAFIAGYKYHADHTPLPEDTALFNKGVEEGKRLMMEEAVKWLVDDDYDELTDKGGFILGSVGIGYNGYYIPYSDLLKLPKEGEK